MFLIALTGGIGAGKSTVAQMLADRGAVVVSADEVAREVVQAGSAVLDTLVEEFGHEIVNDDGSLNRKALARLVFADKQALSRLNDITHPAIFARTQQLFEQHANDDVVVYDVPLLAETKSTYSFDYVIVVTAPVEERMSRLMSQRGMTEDEARQRISSQVEDEERNTLADVLLDTSGSLSETNEAVDVLWQLIQAQIAASKNA